MPLDQRNSTMAKGMHLIFSLFNVASAQEVPFGIPQYVRTINSSWTYQCLPLCSIYLC